MSDIVDFLKCCKLHCCFFRKVSTMAKNHLSMDFFINLTFHHFTISPFPVLLHRVVRGVGNLRPAGQQARAPRQPGGRLTLAPEHFTITPLYHCTITPLHHCTITPLHHFTVIPLHHIIIAPFLGVDRITANGAESLSSAHLHVPL